MIYYKSSSLLYDGGLKCFSRHRQHSLVYNATIYLLTSVGSSSLSVRPFPLPPLFSCPVIWSDVFQFPNDSSTLNWLEEHHSGPYARKSDFLMFVHLKQRSRQRLSMPVFSLVVHSSQEPVSHRPRPVQPLSLFSWLDSWPFIPLGLKSLFMLCPQPLKKKILIMVVFEGFCYF